MAVRYRNSFLRDYADALRASQLKGVPRAIAMAMIHYADKNTGRNCRPGVDRLVSDTGFERSTVMRSIATLEATHWLRTDVQGGSHPGGKRASVYSLTLPTGFARPVAESNQSESETDADQSLSAHDQSLSAHDQSQRATPPRGTATDRESAGVADFMTKADPDTTAEFNAKVLAARATYGAVVVTAAMTNMLGAKFRFASEFGKALTAEGDALAGSVPGLVEAAAARRDAERCPDCGFPGVKNEDGTCPVCLAEQVSA